MKFSLSFSFLALASPVAGFDGSIRADSQMGQKLMGKARQLENNNNYYAYSWMADAALKFDGCSSIPMFEREEGLRSNMVVKFKLCPNNSCGSCRNGGEYIVEMREFVETYQEALKESREQECEYAKESCEYSCQNGGYQYQNYDNGGNYNNNYNNNNQNDDEYCLNSCLADQGLSYCQDEQEEQMDLNEFGECRPMNEENNNNNGNYQYNSNYEVYYTGAYCTSSGIYAGVFKDSTCTKHAPKGTYEKYNYGYSLPTEPLASSTCISCKAQNYDNDNDNNNNNNNGNNNNGDEIAEVCMGLYEEAVKCESGVKSTYKDESGCYMIHHVIPKLSKAMNNIRGGPSTSTVFAWIFGIGFFALAGYLYKLHKKAGKSLVDPGYTLE